MFGRPQDHYEIALRRRVILDYLEENKTTPSKEQVFELMQEGRAKYPNLDTAGFSAYDIQVPYFKKVSSSETHNTNRQATRDDVLVVGRKLNDLTRILEDGYRAFLCTTNKCDKLNSSIRSRLDNMLLLSGRTDVFVHGIEEVFDTSDYIDLENSTVEVNPGYVTLGHIKFIAEDISAARFHVTSYAPQGKISAHQKSSVQNLLYEDGSDWTYYIKTSYPVGPVSAIIEMELNPISGEGKYIGEVVVTGSPMSVNSETLLTAYYSLNGTDFTPVQPTGLRFTKGENTFYVGVDKVTHLRLVMSKRAADFEEEGVHNYSFSVDSIQINSGKFTSEKESVLYAGPYYVVDDAGDAVNFSLATLAHGTCCVIPEETSVSFFLSKDNETWIPASFTEESMRVVQFGSTTPANPSLIDGDAASTHSLITDILKTTPFNIDYELGKEALLNIYIPQVDADKFVYQNAVVKRNLRQGFDDKILYGVSSGWFANKKEQQYTTAVWIDQLDGQTINLGNTSAYINGKLVTGEVYLPYGYHTFTTNFTNWVSVSKDFTTVEELRANDPRYPFNHKLLIEGYPYVGAFRGEKVYGGVGRKNFGALLDYVTPERFHSPELDGDLFVYTIEEYNGNLFFKVKTDPNDGSWKEEEVELSYMLRLEESNALYIKAILRTRDTAISPNINQIQVRVI